MTVTQHVDSPEIDKMTLDNLQAFIDEARAVGMPGTTKISVIGKSEGYHFTGTYQFTPQAVRCGPAKVDKPRSEAEIEAAIARSSGR